MSECTHNCSTCGQNCSSRQEPQSLIEKPHELSNIKKVIGVVSGKGGVGKSLVTSLLSVIYPYSGIIWMEIYTDIISIYIRLLCNRIKEPPSWT